MSTTIAVLGGWASAANDGIPRVSAPLRLQSPHQSPQREPVPGWCTVSRSGRRLQFSRDSVQLPTPQHTRRPTPGHEHAATMRPSGSPHG